MKAKAKKSPLYFQLPRGDDRPIVEGMWVSNFLKAARFSVHSLVAHAGRSEDPPDCEAIVDGAWAGIEAIELVDDGGDGGVSFLITGCSPSSGSNLRSSRGCRVLSKAKTASAGWVAPMTENCWSSTLTNSTCRGTR